MTRDESPLDIFRILVWQSKPDLSLIHSWYRRPHISGGIVRSKGRIARCVHDTHLNCAMSLASSEERSLE